MALNAAVIYVTLFIRLMCIISFQSYYKLKQFRNILSTDTYEKICLQLLHC